MHGTEFKLLPENLLPERWRDDAFIAGGAAAYPSLATDIDVWITVPVANSLEEVRQELLAHLLDKGFRFKESVSRTVDENVSLGYSLLVGGELFLDNRQVALVSGSPRDWPFLKPYHLVVSNGDVHDVLSGFDISTHQVALLANGDRVEGPGYTPVEDMPVILLNTPHTADRFNKIEKRYRALRPSATGMDGGAWD